MHADLTSIFQHTPQEVEDWLDDHARYELGCEKLRRFICDVCKEHGEPEKITVSVDCMKAHSGPFITGKILGIPVHMDVDLQGDNTLVFHFKKENT